MEESKVDLNSNEMHCNDSKNTAVVIGIPMLLLFFIVFQLLALSLVFSLYTAISVIIVELYINRLMKANRIKLANVPNYLRSRRNRIKRARCDYKLNNRKRQEAMYLQWRSK